MNESTSEFPASASSMEGVSVLNLIYYKNSIYM